MIILIILLCMVLKCFIIAAVIVHVPAAYTIVEQWESVS